MLTNPNKVTAAAATQKQIVVQAIVNQTLYTVPTGKKFTGTAFNSGNMQLVVNGIQIVSSSGTTPATVSLTLTEKSVISCGTTYASWALLGVEE